ncbi:photosynthetic complex assembly protein PuhC [Methylobacterium sp.]|jgi:putative photosynthetic complex assembly protein|uniref:photosynthetic complex assembly protein PuhC n=1 Tax=Methylobacterium sp. TaxID=409 RepID=UPI0026074314|nr:photosynthetic complex assembly protein PuhC [Methylobacterium sp.]MDB5647798.1 hypothetical protein [Methylobacterium sp.]
MSAVNPHPLARTAGRTSRGLIAGIGLLLGFVVLAVTFGRVEGVGLTRMEPARPVQSLAFRVDDAPDGSITLRDAEHGGLVATVQPGEDNFIRATLRGFGQGRLRAGLSREVPFRLTRFDDGSLRLDDALTGRSVDFGAFGPSNFAAFARLMPDLKSCPATLQSIAIPGSCLNALSYAEPALNTAMSAGGAAR